MATPFLEPVPDAASRLTLDRRNRRRPGFADEIAKRRIRDRVVLSRNRRDQPRLILSTSLLLCCPVARAYHNQLLP